MNGQTAQIPTIGAMVAIAAGLRPSQNSATFIGGQHLTSDGRQQKMTALGEFIRNRRGELSLTQTSLAIRMGVDSTYVCAVERGRKRPDSTSFLDTLAQALELTGESVGELFAVAQLSQRSLRLPEDLSPVKHAVLTAIVRDLTRFSDLDMEVFATIHAALLRNRPSA